jgi:hypothetical protein
MKNINKIRIILSCILFFCICTKLNAFDCNHLYIGGQNLRSNNYAEVTVTGTNGFRGTDFYIKSQNDNPTLALGPYNKEIVLYWWDYNMQTSAKSGIGSSSPIYYARSNSKTSSIIPQYSTSIKLADRRLSGGTVNQKTGEIYLLTEPCTSTRSISILKPDLRGTFFLSKRSPNLNYTQNNRCRAFSSDMAIDADGNAYLLVNAIDNQDYDKSDYGYKLVKVNPQDWSYDSIRLQNNIEINNEYAWGMAFLNGKLYVATSNNPAVIHTVDPIRGGISSQGNVIMQDGKEYGYGIDDMASCQTASVITGRVYFDKNGDGKIDNSDKTGGKFRYIPNIIVEIYASPKSAPIGYQYTNLLGEYNFLVELGKTYYIRLKQPQINSVNTHQTWASGGEFGWKSTIGIGSNGVNTVIPACYNNGVKIYDKAEDLIWYSGKETKKRYTQICYGAKADGIDPSFGDISTANYYTIVDMRTDLSVAHADFALAPVDSGDAPLSFGEASGYTLLDGVKMGALKDNDATMLTSANADADDRNNQKDEDGVEVRVDDGKDGSWKSLKNFTFNNDKYAFRVKVNKKGFLNAWVNINAKSINLSNFASGTKIADNIEYNGSSGYITFSANIDTKIAVDGGYINGNKASKLQKLFFRFRYSSYNASVVKLPPINPLQKSFAANVQPWTYEGETEDYTAKYQYIEKPTEPKGTLIIVNQNFNLRAGDKKPLNSADPLFALYTQITGKPFKVKMVYYDKNQNGVSQALENTPLLVRVDLVELVSNCQSSRTVQNIFNGNITSTVVELPNIKINKALKNAAFKTTYSFFGSNINKSVCSPDTFALRPESFILEGAYEDKLIGGKETIGKIKAIESGSKKGALGYNQQGANIFSSAALIMRPSCTLPSNVSGDCHVLVENFTDGNAKIDIKYQNVGKVKISLRDKEWANADSVKNDCLAASPLNIHNAKGLVGCDIVADKEINFIADSFAADAVVSNAYEGKFTYLSNKDVMSAQVNTSVRAVLYDGTTASNYHKGCFANNITYAFALVNDALYGWGRRYKTPKERLIFFPNNMIVTDNKNGIGTFKIGEERFISGKADGKFGFNFGRSVKNAENPFMLNPAVDFNITQAEDGDTKSVSTNIGGDNITFFYGRIFSENYVGESPIAAQMRYEIYCMPACVENVYGISLASINLDDSRWFLNIQHNSSFNGDVMFFRAAGKTLIANKMPPKNGISTMNLINNAGFTPYHDVIYAAPESWLIYNNSNEYAKDTSFNVNFIGVPSIKWAGKGEVNAANDTKSTTGQVIDVMPSRKTSNKINW